MEMILASAPDGDAIKTWLTVLGFLVGIAYGIKKLMEKKPSHSELATKAELEKKADKEILTEVRQSLERELEKKSEQKDLDRIQGEVKKLDTDLKETERRIIGEVKGVGEKLSAEIKEFAEDARDGRVALWEKVNPISERLAAVESKTAKKDGK